MDVYLYQAALLCEDCGEATRRHLDADGARPADPEDESTYDSGDYPKGPYPDGGGEADCPQHCDHCGVFLENPLTAEGEAYVLEVLDDEEKCPAEWQDVYAYLLEQ